MMMRTQVQAPAWLLQPSHPRFCLLLSYPQKICPDRDSAPALPLQLLPLQLLPLQLLPLQLLTLQLLPLQLLTLPQLPVLSDSQGLCQRQFHWVKPARQ